MIFRSNRLFKSKCCSRCSRSMCSYVQNSSYCSKSANTACESGADEAAFRNWNLFFGIWSGHFGSKNKRYNTEVTRTDSNHLNTFISINDTMSNSVKTITAKHMRSTVKHSTHTRLVWSNQSNNKTHSTQTLIQHVMKAVSSQTLKTQISVWNVICAVIRLELSGELKKNTQTWFHRLKPGLGLS